MLRTAPIYDPLARREGSISLGTQIKAPRGTQIQGITYYTAKGVLGMEISLITVFTLNRMRLFSQRNQRKKPKIFPQGDNLKSFALKVALPNLQ